MYSGEFKMNKLKGRKALITGGARGIGRSIVKALANEGAQILINYHSSDAEAKALAAEVSDAGHPAILFKGNVGERATWNAMLAKVNDTWGRLDILVNNAGITQDKSLRKMTDQDWLTVLNTNLNACYYGVSAVMPLMIEQKYGRIINISSFVGQAGNFGQANYAASKGGIIAFTKTAALELARYNVTCNALAPGFTETDMLAKVPEAVRASILGRIPMARFGLPDEIAKAVLFLAADADYVTGQQINVNGGVYM
jgi:acetoacetyl-CoA reductase/3-oxoacyl-[acyl-carrier protein] reductase